MALAALGEDLTSWLVEDADFLTAGSTLGLLQSGVDVGLKRIADNNRKRKREQMPYMVGSSVRRRPVPIKRTPYKSYMRQRMFKRRRWYERHRIGAGKHTARTSTLTGSSKEGVPRPPTKYHDLIVRRMYKPSGSSGQNESVLNGNVFGTGGGGFGYNFKLDQMPSYTDFTAMFQYYKILSVELHFVPHQNCFPGLSESSATNPIVRAGTGAAITTAEAPIIIVASDEATSSNFASETDAFSHGGTTLHCFNDGRTFKYRVSPAIRRVVGDASAPIQATTHKKVWLDTGSPSEAHFGLRGFAKAIKNCNSVDVYGIITVAFKDLKT